MIARAKKLHEGDVRFEDISDQTMRRYASAVATAGIAIGQGGRFAPQRDLTRGEAAKMIAAIL
ncbi:MAG: S-layer homology domain-containing protein [Acidobacteriota bacterium]